MIVTMDIPRPDYVNLITQGHRGPFFPLLTMLNASADINEWMMKQKRYPLLYESGVRYKEQLPGPKGEEFLNCEQVLQRRFCDCDQIAPYRAAELRVRFGIPARPCIRWKWVLVTEPAMLKQFRQKKPFKLMLVHVLVCCPYLPRLPGHWSFDPRVGFIDDPCVVLGMKE